MEDIKYIEFQGEKYIRYSYLLKNRKECIEYIDRNKYRTLGEPIIYFIDWENKNEFIIIPPYYIFDFNSSPCYTHCIVDRDEFCIALIHDFLYNKVLYYNGVLLGVIQVIDKNNISKKFKKYIRSGGVYSEDHFNEFGFLYPERKTADLIWKDGANIESELIFGRKQRFKIFIGYLGIRLGGIRKFKKYSI